MSEDEEEFVFATLTNRKQRPKRRRNRLRRRAKRFMPESSSNSKFSDSSLSDEGSDVANGKPFNRRKRLRSAQNSSTESSQEASVEHHRCNGTDAITNEDLEEKQHFAWISPTGEAFCYLLETLKKVASKKSKNMFVRHFGNLSQRSTIWREPRKYQD